MEQVIGRCLQKDVVLAHKLDTKTVGRNQNMWGLELCKLCSQVQLMLG